MNVSSVIEFEASKVFDSLRDDVTLRLISPNQALDFQPALLVFALSDDGVWRAETSITPLQSGSLPVEYEIGGTVSCTCRPFPSGSVCQPGCPDGSGFSPLRSEIIPGENRC